MKKLSQAAPVLVVWLSLVALAGFLASREPVQAQGGGAIWSCSLDNVGATLTRCIAAPTSGESRYITDIVANSTTAIGGAMSLQTGTGTNCGTGTASLFPSSPATNTPRLGYPPTASAALTINLRTPVRVAPNLDLCVLGTTTDTVTVHLLGYVAP